MMQYFDFNFHLPYLDDPDVNSVIEQDLALDTRSLCYSLDIRKEDIAKAQATNFLLFNTQLFDEDTQMFFTQMNLQFEQSTFTALVDFRRKDALEYIEKAENAGVRAIMFNSYLQNITEQDFLDVLKLCQFAEQEGLIICLDGSYGTSKMHNYDNLKLACFIADIVTNVPIVIVHSGGYRVMEFFLLAGDKSNVWLDTSFSLPFYIGSSIEKDFAFVYKKMDARKVVFGTDFPYLNSQNALQIHLDFFERHNFSQMQIEQILYTNAVELFQ
jgi:predicted TIM-barrel fold metal-dependent hydrolase